MAKSLSPNVLINIAIREQFSPIGLCRILLNEMYKGERSKAEVAEMLKYPSLVPESVLATNVSTCLYNDSRDGPLSDMIRQCIGEEYEIKLKALATEAGMHFCDENDLRREGYDKTPDLKLSIPCMYKGTVINWIESKASFGDMDSHQRYLKDQLTSYGNRLVFYCDYIFFFWFFCLYGL